MLTLQLTGQAFNKSEHRRVLSKKLNQRSDTAIERKHQNISAILLERNAPWINGYKPLFNYQRLLFDIVSQYLDQNREFEVIASTAVDRPATMPLVGAWEELVVAPPPLISQATDESAKYKSVRPPIKRDYLASEARNRSLGVAGEEFVAEYERSKLRALGAKKLSERVENVSVTQGDGLGFDVLSFEPDGRERFIEVKTTAFSREAPFYVSQNELEFSRSNQMQFQLYRVFEFRQKPRMFFLPGPIDARCRLDPISYLAKFR